MSIIEKAVERLDQLKKAGVDVPAVSVPQPAEAQPSQPAPVVQTPPPAAPVAKVAPPQWPVDDAGQSKRVNIDLTRLEMQGFVTPNNSRSIISEEFRVIKRPILKNIDGGVAGKHANLIMVTSSVPGEGKSFSSINLAISMAMELDHTVLLVDADVSRPSVLNHLGLPPAPGLMDVLLNPGQDLGEVLLRTNIDKLTLLPAGVPHQRATEFLASDAMVGLLDQIATRYHDRIVIFDSPPLLATTEARVLATHMGQVVMVVEAARTTHAMVKQALATIEACPIRLMLLNKLRDAGAGAYGYYTPYGYGNASAR
ncbi:XrtA-associated tyrosine autokinase [Uliginosibacterium sp. H1]|uniref:XrtA-associated tyrosine autokinase n=1 Tax=Uliginosibacterium sp. H1 TaxID=3114757 RepID=UPI002E194F25|nr:XrtA-associated tyrosine autokinase [Uliginosibacterium sp. H1]